MNKAAWILVALLAFVFMVSCDAGDDDDDGQNDDDDNAADDDDDDDDDDNDDDDTSCDSGLFLTFDLTPQARNVPYPNAVFTTDDPSTPTGIRLNVKGQVTTYVDEILRIGRIVYDDLNRLDGFGVSSPVWFPTDHAPDPANFPDALDPDTDDAVLCAVVEDQGHPFHGAIWALDVTYNEDFGLVQAAPHLAFASNTAYACVATDRLVAADGACYEQPPHLRYMLSAQPDPSAPDAEVLEPYRQRLWPHFARLFEQYALAPEQIVAATAFRTQDITHDLLAVRKKLEAKALAAPPTVGDWVRVEENHPNVDSVWETTYETPGWKDHGVFVYDENSDPVQAAPMQVTLRLTLPAQGTDGYAPPYPVVLYAHGIYDDRVQAMPLARTLAGYGFATIAIDLIFHGDREQGLEGLPDWLVTVVQTLQFINIPQPLKMRDNFKQSVSDFIWLKHVVRNLDTLDLHPYATGGDGAPDLDASFIGYASMSLGGFCGGVLAAVEPDIDTYMFNVGAANWATVALEGYVGSMILKAVGFVDRIFDTDIASTVSLVFGLFMPMIDAGDPYSYGVHVIDLPLYDRPDRTLNILQQMAAYDETLGGPGCSQLARSIGLTQLAPYVWRIDDLPLDDAPLFAPAVFQYDTDNHTLMLHDNEFFDEVHLQAGTFFRTAYENGTATIINPLE